MWTISYIFLCSFVVVVAELGFKIVRPSLMVKVGDKAKMECCCDNQMTMKVTWSVRIPKGNLTEHERQVISKASINSTVDISIDDFTSDKCCGTITFMSVKMNDTGMYYCSLSQGGHTITSPGTYLHVYEPVNKTINISEDTKNKILTAQGILLCLCVLLPAFSFLCQSKRLHELEKKKVRKEEENIYQGLNLDDCYAAYDQIERSQNNGPYQDVCNVLGDDIQLEKP